MAMKKRIEIKEFNNYNSNKSVKTEICYNFLNKDKLYQSFSTKTATFPYFKDQDLSYEIDISKRNLSAIKGITSFKQYFPNSKSTVYRILLYGDDKKVYINELYSGDDKIYNSYNIEFDEAPITLSYKKDDADAIILADKNKMLIWRTNFSPYTIPNVPVITSICMNDGVLFCTIKEPAFKVWYATDLDAENVGNISNNSGYISLNDDLGDAKKILAFDEDVYIFREYGISKINYLQKEITVSQVYTSNSRILENTVSVCGNLIVFMTFDGIYTFNGTRVSKTDINISNLLDGINQKATASSISHYYFLALRLKYDDNASTDLDNENYVNNSILVIDTFDLSFHIMRGIDVLQFHPFKTDTFEKLLVCCNTKNCNKLLEITYDCSNTEKIYKRWQSAALTERDNNKLITNLTVTASKNVTFTFDYDTDHSISFVTYREGLNEFNFRFRCNQLKLQISSSVNKAVVDKVAVEYYDY